MEPTAVFSTATFPSTEYITALITIEEALMEYNELYVKQTNRNRYHIGSPAGVQSLHIPVNHKNLYALPVSQVCISYDFNWQRNHWRTITAAYNRSAYFEFYADELQELFFKRYEFLIDFNNAMLSWILKSIKAIVLIRPTEVYKPEYKEIQDLRYISNLKTNTLSFKKQIIAYPQVFGMEKGFIENLWLPDLLFNMGPAAEKYLV